MKNSASRWMKMMKKMWEEMIKLNEAKHRLKQKWWWWWRQMQQGKWRLLGCKTWLRMGIQFRLLNTKGSDSKHGPLDDCAKDCGTFK
jgi:hypothetical protein